MARTRVEREVFGVGRCEKEIECDYLYPARNTALYFKIPASVRHSSLQTFSTTMHVLNVELLRRFEGDAF